jgi:homoserine kinase type II
VFTSGFENSNYLVETVEGRWVIKIYEDAKLTEGNISFEAQIMDFLFRRGLLMPQVHETIVGELVAKLSNKYAILMDFVEGRVAAKESISDSIMVDIGTQMGLMDKALFEVEDCGQTRQNYEFDHKHLTNLEPRIDLLPSGFDKGPIKQLFEEFKGIQPKFNQLKHAVIHNDVVPHNILARDGRVSAILDMNDFVCSPQVQNLAVTLCQAVFGYNWKPHQKAILIDNYCHYNPLAQGEIDLLDTLVAARYAMLVVQFNYWNIAQGEDVQRFMFLRDQYGFMLEFLQYRGK